MAGLDMDILPENTIIDEVIKRYGRVNGCEDIEDERESAEIARRETGKRRKIKDDTRRFLEEMSKARHDPNVEHPTRDYDGLYIEELKNTYLYNPATCYQSQVTNPVEDDDDAIFGQQY
ncbi:hypothetical protein Syun_018997 [Stephania yunnanensis]|uniref:Uncharacterized protein n=1 Tax=Stephania yunnanensis TaxID=152371 RepID=A0AAP0IUF0_9MAGN